MFGYLCLGTGPVNEDEEETAVRLIQFHLKDISTADVRSSGIRLYYSDLQRFCPRRRRADIFFC